MSTTLEEQPVAEEAQVAAAPEASPEAQAETSEYTKREQEHYEEIRRMERSVRTLELEYEALKEEAGDAKKAFDRADKALRELIAKGADPQMTLPLDDSPAEAWKLTPLAEVKGISKGLLEKMAGAGLENLGQYQAFYANEHDLTEIDGIGPEKANKIADAIADWFKDHPEACGQKTEPDRVPARIKLTQDIGDYANDEDGLYQHVEKDVMQAYANGACEIAIAGGKSLVVSPDSFTVIDWAEPV